MGLKLLGWLLLAPLAGVAARVAGFQMRRTRFNVAVISSVSVVVGVLLSLPVMAGIHAEVEVKPAWLRVLVAGLLAFGGAGLGNQASWLYAIQGGQYDAVCPTCGRRRL